MKRYKEIENIHLRIKEIEKYLNIKKKDIIDATGINYTYYYKAATGVQTPSFDFLVKICTAYNISANWLIWGEGEMFRQNNEPKPELNLETKREINILSKIDPKLRKEYFDILDSMSNLPAQKQSRIIKIINIILQMDSKEAI